MSKQKSPIYIDPMGWEHTVAPSYKWSATKGSRTVWSQRYWTSRKEAEQALGDYAKSNQFKAI